MRTCTIMIMTDGRTTVYGVYRGKMVRKGKAFDAHHATELARYEVNSGPASYRELTAKHATADAPAVYWQA